ncbi:MAG: hypothetical protein PXX82_00220 [Methanomassiliicoccales archaeon]|nr:hypothetical protein [Methanomassiliicoccales archaeon]
MYRKESLEARRIARERIEKLFAMAKQLAREGTKERSRQYVGLARRIGMKLDIPVGHRREYCRNCNSILIPGVTSRTRIVRGRAVITCFNCGKASRYPYRKAKQTADGESVREEKEMIAR